MHPHAAARTSPPQVDAPLLAADTGGLDLAPANALLPRPRRSVRLPAYAHAPLSEHRLLLSVPLASLLPGAAAPPQHECRLDVSAAGTADALCFYFEHQLHEEGPNLSADPTRYQPGDTVLHPHVWQHLQYLDGRQLAPGQAPSVRCKLVGTAGGGHSGGSSAAAAAEALQSLSLQDGSAGSGGSSSGGSSLVLSLQLEVALQSSGGGGGGSSGDSLLLPVSAEQAAVAAAVPRYHTSMLNDSARTAAYKKGIAAALREAQATAAAVAGAAAGGQAGAPPLVLEIGSGSGLLCLLACQAGAAAVVGCERLPELQRAAARLLEANRCADRVRILPKHSRELTIAPSGGSSSAGNGAAGEVARDEAALAAPADLPRRADVLMHEIFGTDPFSEGESLGMLGPLERACYAGRGLGTATAGSRRLQAARSSDWAVTITRQPHTVKVTPCPAPPPSAGVVPSVAAAKQALLRPGAVLAPCRLHVVATVAASTSLHRLLRPPAAVCGGAVVTRALRPLAPRKVDCQAGEAGGLLLLTEPATVLSVDFGAPELPLADSATALLEALPRPLPLAAWMEAQRRSSVGGSVAAGAAPAGGAGDGGDAASSVQLAPLGGAALYAVGWFEYEFPGGVAGSTAPHVQRSEHWQQVVQPLEGEAAAAALNLLLPRAGCDDGSGGGGGGGDSSGAEGSGIAGVLLTAGYRVDRLWFELEGLAAAVDEEREEGDQRGGDEQAARAAAVPPPLL